MANGLNVGKHGSVKVNGNTVINITDWNVSDAQPVIKVKVFDQDTPKIAGSGFREVTGNISGYLDPTDGNYQTNMLSNYASGGSVDLELYFNATEYYSGTAYLTKRDFSATADDEVCPVSYDFELDGTITENLS